MPLTMATCGEPNTIKRVGGKADTKKFLENLGFVTGGVVTVVSTVSGNLKVEGQRHGDEDHGLRTVAKTFQT